MDTEFTQALTQYVVTRWYRAPEVVLCKGQYTESIDLWAVGCVFAELIGRQPLFPGKNHLDQVKLILSITGKVSQEDLSFFGEEASRSFILKKEAELECRSDLTGH